MANLFELKKQRHELLTQSEELIAAAERAGRTLTAVENQTCDSNMNAVRRLNEQIEASEKVNTLKNFFNSKGQLVPAGDGPRSGMGKPRKTFTADYLQGIHEWVLSGGTKMSAAMYEGSSGSGGYAVPITVEGQIVELAPAETGVRDVARVLATANDIKIPTKTAYGSGVAIKAESGSSSNSFAESDPTLGQFTLSAFMTGAVITASFEALQDIEVFQTFLLNDLAVSVGVFLDNKYVNGSGSGQPQGLLGNVGAGVTGEAADGSGNLLSIQSTFDVMGTLNAIYQRNASWLMARATGVELRKAQMQANLFSPVFTTVNGQDYLHGRPVVYSAAMPAVAAGNTPVLFGDFASGYIIGERGGAGINLKILDQPLATQGQIQLLAYQRTDGRVRRSEAIQGITLHT